MQVLRYPQAAVPAALGRQIRELERQAWPQEDEPPGGVRHDPALQAMTFGLLDGDRAIAALDVLSKRITHSGRHYDVSGLSAVVVDEACRGRGYGTRLVEAAGKAMRDDGVDLALFTCDRPLRRFYERAGFELLPGAVLVGGTPQRPFPSDRPGFDKVTMAAFYSVHAHAGRDDFAHSRIELYPGDIDRLW